MRQHSLIMYGGKKLLTFIFSVFILSVTVFYVARLAPGDPLVSYYGDRVEKMSPEERFLAEEKLGLHDPIHVQYVRWLSNAARGELGISFKYKMDAAEVVAGRAGNTLLLGGVGFALLFVLSLLLGTLCAWREDSLMDRVICRVGTAASCIPEFWLSLVLILVFSVALRWLPSSGPDRPPDPAHDRGGGQPSVVLRLHGPQPDSGGDTGGLCAAGPVQGADPQSRLVPALPAGGHALLSEPHGRVRAARAGGHLYCGDGVLLSGAGHPVL